VGQELLGYAQFPDMMVTNPDTDGIVVRTTAFGRVGNITPPYNHGRTATHEVGHWMNLIHIWGDNICGDDLVADTPVQEWFTEGCPNHPRTSCGSHDMFMNYMDYTDDACMNISILPWKFQMGHVPPARPCLATRMAITANASLIPPVIMAASGLPFTPIPHPMTSRS